MVEILVGGKHEQKVITVTQAFSIPEHFLSLVNVQNVENSAHTIFGNVHFPYDGSNN